ncbi:MAG: lasso peptide biosynthesis B2 protein [Brevundimonas sp.]|nr:MAG: lasso peptide biosynthesis B2 protein [Brevundimonas sp.]
MTPPARTAVQPDAPAPALLKAAPGVHLVAVEEDIVVLDLQADQYNCLLDAAGLVQIAPDGHLLPRDAAVAAALLDGGLAVPAFGVAPERRRGFIPPARDLPGDASPSGPVATVTPGALHTLLTLARAGHAFERQTLAAMVAERPAPGPASRPVDPTHLAHIVAAARRLRPWLPREGECLKRAFQLRALLARHGVEADWIFGVRTWPFAAHCWLQVDDLVVGDRLERVRLYTPILRA